MNLVQEMFRMTAPDKIEAALLRLSGLFRVMSEQPGFHGAEVLRNLHERDTLVVLHVWRDLADWQTFQRSPWKVEFTASRPEGLYDVVPCGMNWRSLQADGAREGALLRREVIRDAALPLRTGPGIDGCQTYVFAGEDPAGYLGCTLRLSRPFGPQPGDAAPNPEVVADELYESLLTVRAPSAGDSIVIGRGPAARRLRPS